MIHGTLSEVKHDSTLPASATPAARPAPAAACPCEVRVPRGRLIALVAMIFAFGAAGPIAAKIRAHLPQTAAAQPVAATTIR